MFIHIGDNKKGDELEGENNLRNEVPEKVREEDL